MRPRIATDRTSPQCSNGRRCGATESRRSAPTRWATTTRSPCCPRCRAVLTFPTGGSPVQSVRSPSGRRPEGEGRGIDRPTRPVRMPRTGIPGQPPRVDQWWRRAWRRIATPRPAVPDAVVLRGKPRAVAHPHPRPTLLHRRLAVVYDTAGPRVTFGVIWFAAVVGALVIGPVAAGAAVRVRRRARRVPGRVGVAGRGLGRRPVGGAAGRERGGGRRDVGRRLDGTGHRGRHGGRPRSGGRRVPGPAPAVRGGRDHPPVRAARRCWARPASC